MTLYIVKHGADDYRMHAVDGTVLGQGSAHPDARTKVDWLSEYHNGASILANPTARAQYTDIVTGSVKYRDLTRDGEGVPWE